MIISVPDSSAQATRTFCAGTLARAKNHPLGVWGKVWARLARGQCARCPGIAAVCAGAFSGAECPFPEKCAVLALPDARPLPEVGAQNVRGTFLTPRAPSGPAIAPISGQVPGVCGIVDLTPLCFRCVRLQFHRQSGHDLVVLTGTDCDEELLDTELSWLG